MGNSKPDSFRQAPASIEATCVFATCPRYLTQLALHPWSTSHPMQPLFPLPSPTLAKDSNGTDDDADADALSLHPWSPPPSGDSTVGHPVKSVGIYITWWVNASRQYDTWNSRQQEQRFWKGSGRRLLRALLSRVASFITAQHDLGCTLLRATHVFVLANDAMRQAPWLSTSLLKLKAPELEDWLQQHHPGVYAKFVVPVMTALAKMTDVTEKHKWDHLCLLRGWAAQLERLQHLVKILHRRYGLKSLLPYAGCQWPTPLHGSLLTVAICCTSSRPLRRFQREEKVAMKAGDSDDDDDENHEEDEDEDEDDEEEEEKEDNDDNACKPDQVPEQLEQGPSDCPPGTSGPRGQVDVAAATTPTTPQDVVTGDPAVPCTQ